jgi:hypothetical protein
VLYYDICRLLDRLLQAHFFPFGRHALRLSRKLKLRLTATSPRFNRRSVETIRHEHVIDFSALRLAPRRDSLAPSPDSSRYSMLPIRILSLSFSAHICKLLESF